MINEGPPPELAMPQGLTIGRTRMTRMLWAGGAALAVAAWCWTASAQQSYTPTGVPGLSSGELVTHFQEQTDGSTVLTVVDPRDRVLAVYHIARDTGAIKLRSVRNFALDLRLVEFNSGEPKPDEIRKIFELQN
jgi:hypothetical protein